MASKADRKTSESGVPCQQEIPAPKLIHERRDEDVQDQHTEKVSHREAEHPFSRDVCSSQACSRLLCALAVWFVS